VIHDVLLLSNADGEALARKLETQLSGYGYRCLIDVPPVSASYFDKEITKLVTNARITIVVIINTKETTVFLTPIEIANKTNKLILVTKDQWAIEKYKDYNIIEYIDDEKTTDVISKRVFSAIGDSKGDISSLQSKFSTDIDRIRIYSVLREMDKIEAYDAYLEHDSSSYIASSIKGRKKFIQSRYGKIIRSIPGLPFFVFIATLIGSVGAWFGISNSDDSELLTRIAMLEERITEASSEQRSILDLRDEWGDEIKDDERNSEIKIDGIDHTNLLKDSIDNSEIHLFKKIDSGTHVELSRYGTRSSAEKHVRRMIDDGTDSFLGYKLGVVTVVEADTSALIYAVRISGIKNTEEAKRVCAYLQKITEVCYILER